MFICSVCHTSHLKWAWKCPGCGAWNSLEESKLDKKTAKSTGNAKSTEKIQLPTTDGLKRLESTSRELDGVLGGGLTPGSLILLSGEPWIGKSTLALQMSQWYAETWSAILYVSGEEHIGQISARAHRLGVTHENIELLTWAVFEDIVATINSTQRDLIIIDSISVLSSDLLEGSPGSISQIRTMTEILMSIAKKSQKSILLIGHVTKDGSISGPKSLEHLVDVVLFLEWVRTESYRILRSFKNRFGSADNIWLFRMDEDGLVDLPNPGLEFIDQENTTLSGSALTFTIDGNRPLLVEIEALTTHTKFWYPKRSARGIVIGKLDLLLAVMEKFTAIKLESSDVYINIGRWLSLSEPGIDLAIVAAIMSSKKEIPLGRTLYLGEVSLTGLVKPIYMLDRRLMEAEKLGFSHVVIPAGYEWKIPKWLTVSRVKNIKELVLK
jgi:DNA repair protein RadA/Sms